MKICLLFLVSSCFHITHQVPCKEKKKTDEVIEEQATLVNTNVDSSTTVQQSVSTTRVPQISAREPQTRISKDSFFCMSSSCDRCILSGNLQTTGVT